MAGGLAHPRPCRKRDCRFLLGSTHSQLKLRNPVRRVLRPAGPYRRITEKHSGRRVGPRYNPTVSLRPYLLVGAALSPLFVAGACGSSVTFLGLDGAGGSGGHYVFISGSGGKDGGIPDSKPPPDALPDYVDPGCPDKPPPKGEFSCDPYKQNCKKGEACHIFVDYPKEPCGQEIYGSFCGPAGPGMQGDACGGGAACAAGFVCVITGSGTQCVKLCTLMGKSGCPDGYVCEPIDVKGFGGCL